MTKANKRIEKIVSQHKFLLKFLATEEFQKNLDKSLSIIVATIKKNGKIIVCGNGGSAADSQHMAGELVGRFQKERKPIACIALTTNTSIITGIGNDYSFDKIFSRQIEAIGNNNDLLIVISTSGRSRNIIEAAITGRKKGMEVISLTGARPNQLAEISGINIAVPSKSTPRIQEIHAIIIHMICELVEESLFPDEIKED